MTATDDLEVVTFGCRLNTYESEVMRAHALTAHLGKAALFNTCAVTAEAVRQAKQSIRRFHRENPSSKIIVTGCAAQVDPYKFAAMDEVSFVIGNDLKMDLATYVMMADPARNSTQKIFVNDMQNVREMAAHLVQGFEGKTRAFIQVQNGCDHRCTFCIIPFGRGPSRSVPIETVLEQIRALTSQTYPEIALTGVDITSYGMDLADKPTLGHLVRRVLAETEVKRLRLSSLDPVGLDEELWEALATEPRLMPHLHLSLQAGDDLILKRMKRRHTAQNVLDLCARARSVRPDIVFGADVITGFPTETEEMFENSVRLIQEAGMTWLHVFPYSSREGTPAARMPMVASEIRRDRARRLREVGDRAVLAHLQGLVGKTITAHIERPDLGRAGDFTEIKLETLLPVGEVREIFCYGHTEKYALGRVVA